MDKKELANYLRQRAYRYLAPRPRTKKEVVDFLQRKLKKLHVEESFSEEVVVSLIDQLEDDEYINDVEFVSWWVERRARFRPRSPRVLKAELLAHGIGKELIEDYFEQKPPDALTLAVASLKRRWHQYGGLDKKNQQQRAINYLLSKGFVYSIAKKAFEETIKME